MNHAGSFPDYSKFETLPCYFSTNAYGTPRTTVGGVQCDDFFQAIGVAVAENVDADIGPNLQDENLDIGLNLQDENLDIGLNLQDENQYTALNFQDENVHIGPNLQDENSENSESPAGLNLYIGPNLYIGLNLEDENADIGPNLQDENLNIGPNLQDENLDITLNLQDENVEDERLDHGAPTGTDASLDIGLNVQDENMEDEGLDHGAPPSHASPGATVTEDRHHKTLHTIEVNINYDGTCPLSELWEAVKRDFEAKFNESMANRKRSIGDAAVSGDAAADSSKKKLKIDGDATAGGNKKLKIGGDAAAGGSKKKLNVIGDVDAPRPAGRSLAMRLQNATPAPPHPTGRRNLVPKDQHKSNWGSRLF